MLCTKIVRPIFGKSMCHELLSSYGCLRVLDLHRFGVKTLPRSISRLIHLRYLNLSRTNIKALPASISKLQNLQTLDLNSCYRLRSLPVDIRNLTNLSTLDVDECHALRQMPSGLRSLTSLHTLPLLLVNNRISQAFGSKTPTAQLWDLKNFVHLRGSLKIEIQGLLKDPTGQSNEANLSSKDGLMELQIKFDCQKYEKVSGKLKMLCWKDSSHDEAMLEGLKPHSNLKKLKIDLYRGEKLPSWAVMDNLCMNLPNLVEIQLGNCGRCQQVPTFSQLPYLKWLGLVSLQSVEFMESSLCELSQKHKSFFTSLQELTLMNMDNLIGWGKEIGKDGNDLEVLENLSEKSFPNLSTLHIEECPNLTYMPHCPNVEHLKLVDVNDSLTVLRLAAKFALSGSTTTSTTTMSHSSKLKTLCIDNIGELISLPNECLSHLISLDIRDPELVSTCSLKEVFRRSSNSLKCLKFNYCDSLTSISGGLEHLTLLEKMVIWKCDELDLSPSEDVEDGMPWKALRNLSSLQIHIVPKLVTLPIGLQHLTNLRTLYITFNNRFEALPEWITCFSSLERLELYDCPKLTSLPQVFRELTSLNQLRILECEGLTKRCRGPSGEDWPKIQHIPFLSVHASMWDS